MPGRLAKKADLEYQHPRMLTGRLTGLGELCFGRVSLALYLYWKILMATKERGIEESRFSPGLDHAPARANPNTGGSCPPKDVEKRPNRAAMFLRAGFVQRNADKIDSISLAVLFFALLCGNGRRFCVEYSHVNADSSRELRPTLTNACHRSRDAPRGRSPHSSLFLLWGVM